MADLELVDALTDTPPKIEPEIKRDFISSLEAEPYDDVIGETCDKTDYVPLLDDDEADPKKLSADGRCEDSPRSAVMENGEHSTEVSDPFGAKLDEEEDVLADLLLAPEAPQIYTSIRDPQCFADTMPESCLLDFTGSDDFFSPIPLRPEASQEGWLTDSYSKSADTDLQSADASEKTTATFGETPSDESANLPFQAPQSDHMSDIWQPTAQEQLALSSHNPSDIEGSHPFYEKDFLFDSPTLDIRAAPDGQPSSELADFLLEDLKDGNQLNLNIHAHEVSSNFIRDSSPSAEELVHESAEDLIGSQHSSPEESEPVGETEEGLLEFQASPDLSPASAFSNRFPEEESSVSLVELVQEATPAEVQEHLFRPAASTVSDAVGIEESVSLSAVQPPAFPICPAEADPPVFHLVQTEGGRPDLLSQIHDEFSASAITSSQEEPPAGPIQEELPASPVAQIQEQPPASPAAQIQEEPPASPATQIPEEGTVSPAAQIQEELPAAQIQEELPASPAAQIQEELPAAQIQEELPASPAAQIQEELPASPAAQIQEEPPASPAAQIQEEPPASPAAQIQEEPPASPAAQIQEEPPASPAAQIQEEPPASPAAQIQEEPPASPAAQVQGEPPASPAAQVQVEPPASPAAQVQEEPPASPAAQVQEEPPASPAAQVQEEPPASPAAQVQEEPPASPAAQVQEEPPASPAAQVQEEPPASPAAQVQEEPPAFPAVQVQEVPVSSVAPEPNEPLVSPVIAEDASALLVSQQSLETFASAEAVQQVEDCSSVETQASVEKHEPQQPEPLLETVSLKQGLKSRCHRPSKGKAAPLAGSGATPNSELTGHHQSFIPTDYPDSLGSRAKALHKKAQEIMESRHEAIKDVGDPDGVQIRRKKKRPKQKKNLTPKESEFVEEVLPKYCSEPSRQAGTLGPATKRDFSQYPQGFKETDQSLPLACPVSVEGIADPVGYVENAVTLGSPDIVKQSPEIPEYPIFASDASPGDRVDNTIFRLQPSLSGDHGKSETPVEAIFGFADTDVTKCPYFNPVGNFTQEQTRDMRPNRGEDNTSHYFIKGPLLVKDEEWAGNKLSAPFTDFESERLFFSPGMKWDKPRKKDKRAGDRSHELLTDVKPWKDEFDFEAKNVPLEVQSDKPAPLVVGQPAELLVEKTKVTKHKSADRRSKDKKVPNKIPCEPDSLQPSGMDSLARGSLGSRENWDTSKMDKVATVVEISPSVTEHSPLDTLKVDLVPVTTGKQTSPDALESIVIDNQNTPSAYPQLTESSVALKLESKDTSAPSDELAKANEALSGMFESAVNELDNQKSPSLSIKAIEPVPVLQLKKKQAVVPSFEPSKGKLASLDMPASTINVIGDQKTPDSIVESTLQTDQPCLISSNLGIAKQTSPDKQTSPNSVLGDQMCYIEASTLQTEHPCVLRSEIGKARLDSNEPENPINVLGDQKCLDSIVASTLQTEHPCVVSCDLSKTKQASPDKQVGLINVIDDQKGLDSIVASTLQTEHPCVISGDLGKTEQASPDKQAHPISVLGDQTCLDSIVASTNIQTDHPCVISSDLGYVKPASPGMPGSVINVLDNPTTSELIKASTLLKENPCLIISDIAVGKKTSVDMEGALNVMDNQKTSGVSHSSSDLDAAKQLYLDVLETVVGGIGVRKPQNPSYEVKESGVSVPLQTQEPDALIFVDDEIKQAPPNQLECTINVVDNQKSKALPLQMREPDVDHPTVDIKPHKANKVTALTQEPSLKSDNVEPTEMRDPKDKQQVLVLGKGQSDSLVALDRQAKGKKSKGKHKTNSTIGPSDPNNIEDGYTSKERGSKKAERGSLKRPHSSEQKGAPVLKESQDHSPKPDKCSADLALSSVVSTAPEMPVLPQTPQQDSTLAEEKTLDEINVAVVMDASKDIKLKDKMPPQDTGLLQQLANDLLNLTADVPASPDKVKSHKAEPLGVSTQSILQPTSPSSILELPKDAIPTKEVGNIDHFCLEMDVNAVLDQDPALQRVPNTSAKSAGSSHDLNIPEKAPQFSSPVLDTTSNLEKKVSECRAPEIEDVTKGPQDNVMPSPKEKTKAAEMGISRTENKKIEPECITESTEEKTHSPTDVTKFPQNNVSASPTENKKMVPESVTESPQEKTHCEESKALEPGVSHAEHKQIASCETEVKDKKKMMTGPETQIEGVCLGAPNNATAKTSSVMPTLPDAKPFIGAAKDVSKTKMKAVTSTPKKEPLSVEKVIPKGAKTEKKAKSSEAVKGYMRPTMSRGAALPSPRASEPPLEKTRSAKDTRLNEQRQDKVETFVVQPPSSN